MPSFGAEDAESLKDYRVALVTTHGPELPEFDIPLNYLRDRGASVDVVTQDWLFDWQPAAPGAVVLAQWLAINVCVQADKKVSDAKIDDYDAVIIIGGAWNPIMLRTDPAMKNFICDAHKHCRLVAAICHGPQLLISSKAFPPGTTATSVKDVRVDLVNADFRLPGGDIDSEDYDKAHPVVYDADQRLITSPNPNTLKEFCEEIGTRLREIAPMRSQA
jgi:protease I